MKWYLKCFIVALLLCCTAYIPAVLADSAMPLIVSDLNFSQRTDGACYQTGSNTLSVSFYAPEFRNLRAMLLFAVKSTDTAALQAIGAKTGFIAPEPYPYELSFEIPDGIDIAKTRGTLLVLDADTMQPLASAITISPQQSYPYISTPQKTRLLQTLSGTVETPGAAAFSSDNTVTVQTENGAVTLPVTPEVAASLPLYQGNTCDCFIDIDTNGQRTISAISLQTLTISGLNIHSVRSDSITYRDTENGEQCTVELDQALTIYRHGLPITGMYNPDDIYNLANLLWEENNDHVTLADTDGNGKVDLINIRRTDHAAVVGIDGTTVQTANMGALDLSQTLLTDKTGAAIPPSQLRAGDVLAVTWHPGRPRAPYQAVLLPASYVDGTVTGMNRKLPYVTIDETTYYCFMPNASYPYQFPLSVSMEGRFYLDMYGNIFAVSVQDSFQPCDWLQDASWADWPKEFVIQTTCHGTHYLAETDTLHLQDNTGAIRAVTPMDILSAEDFSGTTFALLFDGQPTLPLHELLSNLPKLTKASSTDDWIAHAVGAAYDYTAGRLTLFPMPLHEKTALQDVTFTKADMTLTGAGSCRLAQDALLMKATYRSNDIHISRTTAEQIPDGAYDMLLYGKDDTGRYHAAIFIRSTQWQQAQLGIVEQISQNADNTQIISIYTQTGSKELRFTNDSLSADTGEIAGSPVVGDVILYLTPGDTVQQYLTLGKADTSNPLQFATTQAMDNIDVPGVEYLYGYAADNDGETLTIASKAGIASFPVPSDFTVIHADYSELAQDRLTISPAAIDAVISQRKTMSSQNPSAMPVMACLHDGTLVNLIAFTPLQTFRYRWEDCSMTIITRVVDALDKHGNPLLNISAVQDGNSKEILYRLSSDSINADTGKTALQDKILRKGAAALFFADPMGNVSQYRIVGTPNQYGNVPFTLTPAFAAEDNGIADNEYRLGYITSIRGERIELYFPNATQWQNDVYRTVGVNEYHYTDDNDSVEVGRYDAGYVDEVDEYMNECSYVLVHLQDGELADIYSFNKRCPIPQQS